MGRHPSAARARSTWRVQDVAVRDAAGAARRDRRRGAVRRLHGLLHRRRSSCTSIPTSSTRSDTSPRRCCSRHPARRDGTLVDGLTTSTVPARCWSTAPARSTSTGRGRAARTTAGCSPPRASTRSRTARRVSPIASGAGASRIPTTMPRTCTTRCDVPPCSCTSIPSARVRRPRSRPDRGRWWRWRSPRCSPTIRRRASTRCAGRSTTRRERSSR